MIQHEQSNSHTLCGVARVSVLLVRVLLCLGLYGQVTKRIRWMPWQLEAMKDVVVCDKPRGADKQALIRGFPNGATRPLFGGHLYLNT